MEPIEWITITEFVLLAYRARTIHSKLSDIISAFKSAKLSYTYQKDWALGDAFMSRMLALIAFSSIWRYLVDLGRQQSLAEGSATSIPALARHDWFVQCMMYFDERYSENLRGTGPENSYDPFLNAMMITYVEKAAPEWDLAIRREVVPNNFETKAVPSLASIIFAMHTGDHPIQKEAAVVAGIEDIIRKSFRELSGSEGQHAIKIGVVYANLCSMFADDSLRDAIGEQSRAKAVVEFNSSASHVLTAMLLASQRRQIPSFASVTPSTILMPTIPPMGRRQTNSWMSARTGYCLDTTLQSAFLTGKNDDVPEDIAALLLFCKGAGTPAPVAAQGRKKAKERQQEVLTQEEVESQIREHLESEDPRAPRNKPKLVPVEKRTKHRN